MNYGIITNPSAAQVQAVQSADPTDLQNLVNAALLAVVFPSAITNITLAGGGDGHTFVVLIESAPPGAAQGGLPGSVFGFAGAQVRCYLAGTGEDLEVAKAASGLPAPIPAFPPNGPIPYVLSDEQVAGSSKGTRFMGMTVFAASSLPIPLGAPIAQTSLVNGSLAAGPNFLNIAFVTIPPSNGFGIVGGNVLQYVGGVSIEALADVSVVVTGTGVLPALVNVELVQDPFIAAVVLAIETVQLFSATDNEEAVSFPSLAFLQPAGISPAASTLGVRITAPTGFAGTASGYLRVAAR